MQRQLLLLLFTFLVSGFQIHASKKKYTNIVFILADDQGYGDLSCFGSQTIATPNIDKIANEGLKFTNFYVHNRCSPTRMALMTGSHSHRAGTHKVIYRRTKAGINPNEITIAEKLKEAGYATGIVGKWHLGEYEEFNPVNHGFDSFYGFMEYGGFRGKERITGIYKNKELIEKNVHKTEGIHSPKLLEAGLSFIEQHKDHPFFLYYSSPLPHTPWVPNEKFKGSSKHGVYGDVVQEIDWQVGELLKKLDDLELADNTLIIYTSDNGPQLNIDGHGSPGILRDGKWTDFEGGIRVPCVMRWPEKIKAGTENQEIVGIIDMLPTFCEIVNVKEPQDRVIDGKSILPYLYNEKLNVPIHETFIVPGAAIRHKDWKLLTSFQKPGGSIKKGQGMKGRMPAEEGSLFNLKNDISEKNNVASENPEKVTELKEKYEAFMTELNQNKRKLAKIKTEPQ